jgi:AcrR family transcriptional regulator
METTLPDQNDITTHRQVRAYGHELLRRNVIDAAARLLREEGPDALTVRNVAKMLDCSTKIIYTTFKGKDGLADALYMEGQACLAQIIGQVQKTPTPGAYLSDVAWAYWAFARDHPSYYTIMFCSAIPRYQPSAACIDTTTTALESVVGIIQHYREQGMLEVDDPVLVIKALWAALHGVVSLHFAGHFPRLEDAKEVFECTTRAIIASFVADTLPSTS